MSRYEFGNVSGDVDDKIATHHREGKGVYIRLVYYVLFWCAIAAIAHFGSLKIAILVLAAQVFHTFFNSFTMHYENIVDLNVVSLDVTSCYLNRTDT